MGCTVISTLEDLKVNQLFKHYDERKSNSFSKEEFCLIVKQEVFKYQNDKLVWKTYGPFIDLMLRSTVDQIETNRQGRIDKDGIVEFMQKFKPEQEAA